MMEHKLKEEDERKLTKEMVEEMSLEETKEQVRKMDEKLLILQEEKHQLFLQLKNVLLEEDRRRREEQDDISTLSSTNYKSSKHQHSAQHLLRMHGSPLSHNRTLLGERGKQLFQTPLMPGYPFQSQQGFPSGSSEHGLFSESSAVHEPYAVTRARHHSSYGAGASVPISLASTTQIRGPDGTKQMSGSSPRSTN